MDNFLEDVSRTTPCSDCRHVLSDMKQMREQMTFLTHQIVQLMQVLCINNCRCVTCQSFIGSSKLFSKNHANSELTVSNGVLHEHDEPDEEGDLLKSSGHPFHENGFMSNGGGPIRRCNKKRTVVGVDQILPKLLAERVSGDVYSIADVNHQDRDADDIDDDEGSPKVENMINRSNGVVRCSSSTDLGSQNGAAGDDCSINNFDDDDKMDDGSLEGNRIWLHKRHRFSTADDGDANAGSRSTGSLSAVDRSCFLNESPCSSGSLELPKTSADTIGSNDLVCVDDQNATLTIGHDRNHRYGYATNVASMSAGLPLVMPGPKATTFFCTICNREFSNVYYKRHMIVHANSRPYVCDVCGKRFNERSNMMKHKQRLHGP